MEENKIIRTIATLEFSDETKRDLFVDFMETRFPTERCESYVMEWVERFKSGCPKAFMDEDSLAIYNDLVKQ